jgi:hypothetical protein
LFIGALPEPASKVNADVFFNGAASPSDEYVCSKPKHKWLVRLYLLLVPLATIVWLAGIGWGAIRLAGYMLS